MTDERTYNNDLEYVTDFKFFVSIQQPKNFHKKKLYYNIKKQKIYFITTKKKFEIKFSFSYRK